MKQHLIKEFLPKGSDRENHESNRYSIYKNPDPQLREEIKNFKIDSSKVTLGWPEKEWTIAEYEGDEVKCTAGRDVKYFPLEEIKRALQNNLEYQRNQKYFPHNYFKKGFGIISFLSKYEGGMTLKKIDLSDGSSLGKFVGATITMNPTKVECYETFYDYEVRKSDNQLYMRASVSGRLMNLYFNDDGDYVNRNYNENLNYYKCEDISPTIVVEHFMKELKKLSKSFIFGGGKYYTEKYCIKPYGHNADENHRETEFGVELHPVRPDGITYKQYRGTTYKLPKKIVEVNSDVLIGDVMNRMPSIMKKLLDLQLEPVNT